jgi:hypothetical protein
MKLLEERAATTRLHDPAKRNGDHLGASSSKMVMVERDDYLSLPVVVVIIIPVFFILFFVSPEILVFVFWAGIEIAVFHDELHLGWQTYRKTSYA